MINYLNKKIQRLLISRNFKKIFYFYHYLTGGYKSQKIDISFKNKKNRIEIIQNIINLKKYNSYLEIGTFKDELFNAINCENKVGVDPVSGGNIRKTSDQFFNDNKNKFDLIFIDGLHLEEQVDKDIANSLKHLNKSGFLIMHDCNPPTKFHQREQHWCSVH